MPRCTVVVIWQMYLWLWLETAVPLFQTLTTTWYTSSQNTLFCYKAAQWFLLTQPWARLSPHQFGRRGCMQTCTPTVACHRRRRDQAVDGLVWPERPGPTMSHHRHSISEKFRSSEKSRSSFLYTSQTCSKFTQHELLAIAMLRTAGVVLMWLISL